MFLQGLVLMVAGMGLVVTFLSLLVGVMVLSAKIIPRFNHVLPDAEAKTRVRQAKAPKASSGSGAEASADEIAVALAAAAMRQRGG